MFNFYHESILMRITMVSIFVWVAMYIKGVER